LRQSGRSRIFTFKARARHTGVRKQAAKHEKRRMYSHRIPVLKRKDRVAGSRRTASEKARSVCQRILRIKTDPFLF
jgi:hypothetical protein